MLSIQRYFHNKKHFGLREHQFWADLVNTASAIVYLGSQCLYYAPSYGGNDLDSFFNVTAIQAWLYFISLAMWAVNSLQYWAAWRVERKEWGENAPFFKDPYMYAELLNVVASFGLQLCRDCFFV
jgi:hypothetical protein